MREANIDIKLRAAGNGVKLWEVADQLGIADTSLSRKLRKELPAEEKEKIFGIIDKLAEEKHEQMLQIISAMEGK